MSKTGTDPEAAFIIGGLGCVCIFILILVFTTTTAYYPTEIISKQFNYDVGEYGIEVLPPEEICASCKLWFYVPFDKYQRYDIGDCVIIRHDTVLWELVDYSLVGPCP